MFLNHAPTFLNFLACAVIVAKLIILFRHFDLRLISHCANLSFINKLLNKKEMQLNGYPILIYIHLFQLIFFSEFFRILIHINNHLNVFFFSFGNTFENRFKSISLRILGFKRNNM